MKKRLSAIILAAVMVTCLLPTVAFAAPINGPKSKTVYIGQNYPQNTAAAEFSANIGSGETCSVTGALPAGMSFFDVYNNKCFFRVVGTPAAGTAGQYTITASSDTENSTMTCTITVAKGSQTIHVDDGATADVSTITIPMGADYTLDTYSKDGNGNKIDVATVDANLVAAHQPKYTYASSDENIAKVNSTSGVVTPVARGTTTITINSAATESYTAADAKTITLNVGYRVTNRLNNVTTGGKAAVALNTDYSATLTADTGYRLPASITVKVGDTELTAGATTYNYNSTSGALTIYAASITYDIEIIAVADKIIDFAAIDGVTVPKAGDAPVAIIADCAQYTGTVTWTPAATTFGYATSYTATITLTPKTGYTLTGVGADFFTVTGATATNIANSGVITAVFPATANAPSSGGGVTTYPVTLPSTVDGGTVSVSPKNASTGTTVTITAKPNDGKQVDKVTVTDNKGNTVAVAENADGTYSFKQPSGGSKVSVSFKNKAWVNPFTDVKESDWFYDNVQYVYEQGLMQGTSKTTFSPNTTTTRGMIVTILWRLEESPVVNYAMSFEDVPAGAYYTEAVRWAASNHIVNGYGNDKFGPNDPITREQMAAILYRYEQYKGGGFTGNWMFLLDFSDRDKVSDYAYESVCWMTMNGIINGRSNGTFDPQGNATRAEAAAMLHRFCEKIAESAKIHS